MWIAAIFALFFLCYAGAFYLNVSEYWFSPDWATDDSMQQIYPFYKVLHPGAFKDDLITKMMECYLSPAHYWISALITRLTGDPILMGHWVMLLQLVGVLVFLFLLVKKASGAAPAFFACAWLLHTRHTMARLAGGLPRGWSPLVFSAVLYFIVAENHAAVLVTLFIGCLLHPPATLIAALTYGLYLLWKMLRAESRERYRGPLLRYLLLAPIYVGITLSVLRMPQEIGTMATLERASQMVEFQRPNGRFPFLPFRPATEEIRVVAFQAFSGKFPPGWRAAKPWMPTAACLILCAVVIASLWKRVELVPIPLWCFGFSALAVYFAARVLAFRLYVPDRHLQIPGALFFISVFSIAVWRVGTRLISQKNSPVPGALFGQVLLGQWCGALLLALLGGFVYLGLGDGLSGTMNFNTWRSKRGEVWNWLKANTPPDSIVAGNPTFIDPVMLFAERQAFVTNETTHPFYDRYYEEMKRRTEVILRAYYAPNWEEVLKLLKPERVRYLVFQKAAFKPSALGKFRFFPPFDGLAKQISSMPADDFVYRKLPKAVDAKSFPPLVFADAYSAVVDLRAVEGFLEASESGRAENSLK